MSRHLRQGAGGQARDELIAHLETCEPCRERIEAVTAECIWWEDLRHVGFGDDSTPPSGFRSGVSNGPSPADEWGDDADWLAEYLAPSLGPFDLGMIGTYPVERVLGRGSMGVVFKGTDPQLNRLVAIKVIHPRLALSPEALRRFARESRSAAAIADPHVVPIYAVSEWRGLPFHVMQFVAGDSLQERIEAGPIAIAEVLRIGIETAKGLAAAHARGIVHRDVKPANILLEEGTGRVRITDFGLAQSVDGAGLTHAGVIVGTPHYMAPEQATGTAVDSRADLFSLGSVLYALCCGSPPFMAGTPLGVLRKVVDERARPIRELNPNVTEGLSELIESLHVKDPAARCASATETLDRLQQIRAAFEVQGTVDPAPPAAEPPSSRADDPRTRPPGRVVLLM